MKTCLILDANFLLANNKVLNEIKEKIKKCVDIYIPRIVIEEVKGQKSRNLEDNYSKIQLLLEQNSKYFSYTQNFKLDEIKEIRESGIEKYLSNYCDHNIIEYDNSMFSKIIQRSIHKITPFVNEQGSSDKGFKDTILWCSLLEFKKAKEYNTFILMTDDKDAFHKKADFLVNEFKETTKKEIIIIKNDIQLLYETLGLSKKDKISIEKEDKQSNVVTDIQSLKLELNSTMSTILSSTFYDEYQDEPYTEKNFTIYKKIRENDLELFFDMLPQYIENHIFFDYIDITELLSNSGIDCEKENNVSLQALQDLLKIYNQVKTRDDLYKPFLTFVINQFNTLYKFREVDYNDPFAEFGDKAVEIDDDFLN